MDNETFLNFESQIYTEVDYYVKNQDLNTKITNF